MFSTTDTIVAIATPPGRGGIGVVRLSGPNALGVARSLITQRAPLQPRHATYTKVRLKPDTTDAAELPVPTDGAELPVPTDGAELPVPTDGAELPVPTDGAELPVPTDGAEPPVPTDGAELPVPTDAAELPVPTDEAGLSVPTDEAGLSVPTDDAGLSAPVVSGFSRTSTPGASDFSRTSIDAIDQVVATFFPGPHSYTGDDVVELSAHGSPVVLRAIVAAAMTGGARLAEPGEFTLRAFLNGRIDLMQAEAVGDLIDAVTPLQARAAFDQLDGTLTRAIAAIDATLFDLIARLEASVDFPEEGYHFVDPGALARAIDGLLERTAALLGEARRGRLIREGLQIAIVGAPNVGKSSLFNALAGASRAIVTDVPGTTRDLVTEVVDIEGLRVTLVDTAGLRDSRDPVEMEGIARAQQSMAVADLVLRVEDRSRPRRPSEDPICKVLYVANKSDLAPAWDDDRAVPVSATTGAGVDELRRRIADALDVDPLRDRPAMTNVRHAALVERAHAALARARTAALADGTSLSEEFVLADLSDARAAFEEISGRTAPEDVLAHIFARFCIGK